MITVGIAVAASAIGFAVGLLYERSYWKRIYRRGLENGHLWIGEDYHGIYLDGPE